jgi:hypothetical protein
MQFFGKCYSLISHACKMSENELTLLMLAPSHGSLLEMGWQVTHKDMVLLYAILACELCSFPLERTV